MKVAYFGNYQSRAHFPRNDILITGLRQNGVKVVECRSSAPFRFRWISLLFKFMRYGPFDVIIVGVPGHADVIIAKFASLITGTPLVFDVFISLYDTNVFDRELVKKNSFFARWFFFLDKISCLLPDVLLFDTQQHIRYFRKTFGINKDKCHRVLVGTHTSIFRPRKRKTDKWIAYYHGKFIPLQGVPVIVQAARILKESDIEFHLLGDGHDYEKVRRMLQEEPLKKLSIFPRVKYEQLPERAAIAGVFLAGPFGKSGKAARVIPNKVYEALSMKLPTIVADTKATREIFSDEDCIFCPRQSPKKLAEKILWAKSHPHEAQQKAEHGYRTLMKTITPKIAGKQLKQILDELINA